MDRTSFYRYICALSLIFLLVSLSAAETIGRYASSKSDGRSVILTTDLGQRIRLTPYGDHIVRVQSVRSGEAFFSDDRYEMVESHRWTGSISIAEDSLSVSISANALDGFTLYITKDPLRISFGSNEHGSGILNQHLGISWNGDTISESFHYDDQEHFTGLGHGYYGRESSIDRRGTVVERNYGTLHGQQAPLLVPFFLSSKGYGLFLNSTFTNRFSFGHQGRFEFSIAGEGRMDYFFILGPGFRSILDRYTQLTGRPRMFPRSALGLALSDKGNDHTSDDPSDEKWWKRKITEHRAAGFPLDHIVNDNRWRAGGGQRCLSRFDWDRERYPDPAEYAAWVKKNGLILTLDLNRCISSHSDGWDPSFNIPQPDSIDFRDSAPDLSSPAVREWFWQLFWSKSLDPALRFPGDALWIDEFDEMGKAPLGMTLSDGRRWRELRNYWFFLIAKALVQQGWDKSFAGTKRPFVWVRGMTAGGQRYATLWSGDIKPSYDDMRSQVRGLQFAGLSGFPFWGHDAGGFNNWEENHGPNDLMYRQWSMAFGSFTPFWKPHGIGASRWPLDRPAEVQNDAKRYAELRYRTIPYIYTYMHRAFQNGLPIARAMVIDHQNDPLAWEHDLQYMWGEELLVAPNCSDSGSVPVWLPKGRWFDFWSDSILSGDKVITYDAPTGKLPLFVKAGSIIPMGPYALSTAFLSKDSLTLHVYPGEDAGFELYEDDGITEQYRTSNGKRTTALRYEHDAFRFSIAPAVGTFEKASLHRSYRLEFHGMDRPHVLALNGKKLTTFKNEREARKAKQGVVWNKQQRKLIVFLKTLPVSRSVVITSLDRKK